MEQYGDCFRIKKILNLYKINFLNDTFLIHLVYFYQNSENLHICIQLDFPTLVTLSQLINLINVEISIRGLYSRMNL